MAEVEKTVTEKTSEQEVAAAPLEDKTDAQETTLDGDQAEEVIDETVALLNIIDKEAGGTGEIAEIPEGMAS